MIAAVVISVIVMLLASGYITRVIEKHPTLKMLALAFLLLIGVTLLADGFGQHIDKGYIYFAMAFAVLVEMLNIRRSSKLAKPVKLHDPYHETGEPFDGASQDGKDDQADGDGGDDSSDGSDRADPEATPAAT